MAATEQHPIHEHSPAVASSAGAEPVAGHPVAGHGVDPRQEPSAEWGWHGTFPRATAIAGWISAAALFLMLIGNHKNHVEDVWLISLGTLLVVMLISGHLNSRRSKRG